MPAERITATIAAIAAVKTIAKACNLSVTTVRRALTDLEDGGWIDIAQRFTDNGQESNLYTVLNI